MAAAGSLIFPMATQVLTNAAKLPGGDVVRSKGKLCNLSRDHGGLNGYYI